MHAKTCLPFKIKNSSDCVYRFFTRRVKNIYLLFPEAHFNAIRALRIRAAIALCHTERV